MALICRNRHRTRMQSDREELVLAVISVSGSILDGPNPAISQRRKNRIMKYSRPFKVTYTDGDMIKHNASVLS